MRTRAVALVALLLQAGCGGVKVAPFVNVGAPFAPRWAGSIIQPVTSPYTIGLQSTGTIVIQMVPVNGTVVTPQDFLNGFNAQNPEFASCNGVVNVVNDGLTQTPIGFTLTPTISLTLTPVKAGACVLQINLGQNPPQQLTIDVD